MAKPNTELPHEKHNRLAYEVGSRILEEIPRVEDRIILLSSIAKGVICLSTSSREKRLKLADIFVEELNEQMNEINISDGVEAQLDVTDSYPIQMHDTSGALSFRIARDGSVEFGPAFAGDTTSRKFVDQLALMVGEKFCNEARP